MTKATESYSTYLLVDTALMIGRAPRALLRKRHRPSWVQPVYDPIAVAVTPIVIDVQKAYDDGRIGEVIRLTSCCSPQLHVSVIHSHISLTALVAHLRTIAYIFTEEKQQLTLRFADCVVAKVLPSVLTEDQWSKVTGPFTQWLIHDLDNSLLRLPIARQADRCDLPLVLRNPQVEAMKVATQVHKLIADVKRTTPSVFSDQPLNHVYSVVEKAQVAWIDAGARDSEVLLELATHAVRTNGDVLNLRGVQLLLRNASVEEIRRQLYAVRSKP